MISATSDSRSEGAVDQSRSVLVVSLDKKLFYALPLRPGV